MDKKGDGKGDPPKQIKKKRKNRKGKHQRDADKVKRIRAELAQSQKTRGYKR